MKAYQLNGKEYCFDSKRFSDSYNHYKKENSLKANILNENLADAVSVSSDTIRKWRSGSNSPSDIAMVQDLANFLGIKNWQDFLKERVENEVIQFTERQLSAIKRIYDAIIDYLTEFEKTDGFNALWFQFNDMGINNPESNIEEYAEEERKKVELVHSKEYFDLRGLEIYTELQDYISDDLRDIFGGKCSYAYRFEAYAENEGPSTWEDYENNLNKINSIIEKYT